MAICSACESDFDVDEFDVDRGDQLSCPECGANLVVSALSPLELASWSRRTAGTKMEMRMTGSNRALGTGHGGLDAHQTARYGKRVKYCELTDFALTL